MFLNALDKRHPLFAGNLWIVGTSLPQPAPVFEVGLTDREVRLTNRVSFGHVRTYGFVARISGPTGAFVHDREPSTRYKGSPVSEFQEFCS